MHTKNRAKLRLWEARRENWGARPPGKGTGGERDDGGAEGLASLLLWVPPSAGSTTKNHRLFLSSGDKPSQTGGRGSGRMAAGSWLSTGSDHGSHQVACGRGCRWPLRASIQEPRGGQAATGAGGRCRLAVQHAGWEGGSERPAHPVSSLDAQMGVSRAFFVA